MLKIKRKKIGLIGGTFDPIHLGHIHLAKTIKNQFKLDEVWLIPTYKNPDKFHHVEGATPQQRLKMVELVTKKNKPWLKCIDYEIKNKKTSYTIETVDYLTSSFPNNSFYFFMGDDVWEGFHNWKGVDDIVRLVNIVVVKRNKKVIKKNDEKYDIKLFNEFEPIKYSSSDFRNGIINDNIPNYILKYISSNFLYLKEILQSKLNKDLLLHSTQVATKARQLAKIYKINLNKAYFAGFTHDFTKDESIKWHKEYLLANLPFEIIETLHKNILHSYSAMFWLKDEYGIKDSEFLNAILYHSTSHPKMTKFQKIIYVADKISDDRIKPKEFLPRWRELVNKNLNQVFWEILDYSFNDLKFRKLEIDNQTIHSHEYYLNKWNYKPIAYIKIENKNKGGN